MKTNLNATNYLHNLERVTEITEGNEKLLFPPNVKIEVLNNGNIKTNGLNNLDNKNKDLLTIIKINDAITTKYSRTNIISPRTYAESLSKIPCHITVQGVLVTKMDKKCRDALVYMQKKYLYNKTEYDKLWIGSNKIDDIQDGEIIIIMNRRVGGWDGSINRPVIELLGAGGHVPTLWDENTKKFIPLAENEAIRKEAQEELGLVIKDSQVLKIGGFHNEITNELVILYLINVENSELLNIQENAYGNIQENIDGLYFGEIENVIDLYNKDATSFAGGEDAKQFNFPSQKRLMKKLFSLINY